MIAITMVAIAIMLCACPSAKAPTPPPAPAPPSALVVTLDALEVATATATPWFPGAAGQWLNTVTPTAMEIATDLQQPNPFQKAQAIDQTLRSVILSEPAASTMSDTQKKMAESVVGAIDAFLTIYEQQAGITPVAVASHNMRVPAGYPLNDADLSILKQIQKGQ